MRSINLSKAKVGEILLGQRFLLNMSMNESESSEAHHPVRVTGEIRNRDPFLSAYDNDSQSTLFPNQDADLAPDFTGNLSKITANFRG